MPDERRRYFRIEDTVSFTVTMIDSKELQGKITEFWSDQKANAGRHMNHQIDQHRADFNVIEKNMPELARYLTVLQTQIDSLTARVMPEQSSLDDDPQEVSLSGQGMAYTTDQKMIVGNTVDLSLKLLSTGQIIRILAQVVGVKKITGQTPEQYRISLDFSHIYESDQEFLVKRIHAQQLKEIAATRSSAG